MFNRRDSARAMVKPELGELDWPSTPAPTHGVATSHRDTLEGPYQPADTIFSQNPRNRSCSMSRTTLREPAANPAQENMARHPDVQQANGFTIPTSSTGIMEARQVEFHHRQAVTPSRSPISRPTTPSALPRPTSRMSLSGRYTPHRTVSLSSSDTLVNANEPARSEGQFSVLVGRASPALRRPTRSLSGPIYGSQSGIPPVPALPSQQELAAKEASRALRLSSCTHGPNSHGATATHGPFYDGGRSVPMITTPERPRVSSATGARTRLPLDSPSKLRSPPSSFRAPPANPSRPSSSMSSRARARTPTSAVLGQFIPNPLDELDIELARVLQSVPTFVQVERTDLTLRKGQLHEGEWTAQYAFTSRGERTVHSCRLLEFTRSGGNVENRAQKVMIREKGGESRLTVRHGLLELTLRFSLDRLATILI